MTPELIKLDDVLLSSNDVDASCLCQNLVILHDLLHLVVVEEVVGYCNFIPDRVKGIKFLFESFLICILILVQIPQVGVVVLPVFISVAGLLVMTVLDVNCSLSLRHVNQVTLESAPCKILCLVSTVSSRRRYCVS